MTGCGFRTLVLLALFVIPLGWADSAHAVDFNFSGTVTQPGAFFPGSSVGDPFTGTLYYDPTRPDTDPDPSLGNYNMSDPSHTYLALSISVGGVTIGLINPSLSCSILVSNLPGGDTFTAGGEVLAPSSITLSDSTGAALTSDALPTNLDIANWDSGVITVRDFVGVSEVPFIGTINGTRAVPEPTISTLLAMASVALALDWLRRTKKAKAE